MNWETLTTTDQLELIDEASQNNPVVLFKHSTRCSISGTAKDRIERKWDESQHPNVKIYYLDLIQYRQVSNVIAERYGVEHQSPQILVIEGGKCTYYDSHLGINYHMLLDKIAPISI